MNNTIIKIDAKLEAKSNLPLEELRADVGEFKRKLDFLDSLCRMGETPDEIEHYVTEAAKHGAVLACAFMNSINGPKLPLSLSTPFFIDLFGFTYLWNEERRRSIANLSKSKVVVFLESVTARVCTEHGEDRTDFAYSMITFAEICFDMLEHIGAINSAKSKLAGLKAFQNIIKKESKSVSGAPRHCH